MTGGHPIYDEFAEWWPLLSPPSDYDYEIEELFELLESVTSPAPRRVLELGCGGGSVAHHMKQRYELTLSDLSAGMLAVSRAINPECEHVQGDMRTLELGREFDAVMIHDAIMYASSRDDLRATLATAYRHCRIGGGVLALPDCTKETFVPSTEHGGQDAADGRGLRYLEWAWDPDPDDDSFLAVYSFLLRDSDGSTRVFQEHHPLGLFATDTWLELLHEVGFAPRTVDDSFGRSVFLGVRES